MAAIGTCWATDSWLDDTWADGSWTGSVVEPPDEEEETPRATAGGWVRDSELRRVLKEFFSNTVRIRAHGPKASGSFVGLVENPEYVEDVTAAVVEEVFVPPSVVVALMAMGPSAAGSLPGEVGLVEEETQRVEKWLREGFESGYLRWEDL
jgi:hypothetical protein